MSITDRCHLPVIICHLSHPSLFHEGQVSKQNGFRNAFHGGSPDTYPLRRQRWVHPQQRRPRPRGRPIVPV
jgi:hypothetical protein